jgi:hypothetical protein
MMKSYSRPSFTKLDVRPEERLANCCSSPPTYPTYDCNDPQKWWSDVSQWWKDITEWWASNNNATHAS